MCAAPTAAMDSVLANMTTISAEAKLLFSGAVRESAFGPRAIARSMPGLMEQRRARQNCDVVFCPPGDAEIWAHRFILSAEYPGCAILFTAGRKVSNAGEPPEPVPPVRVIVTDLNRDMIELLVDSAYSAPLEKRIWFHNVAQVLELSQELKVNKIRRHCLNMLERNLAPDTCIGTYHLALKHRYSFLAADALRFLIGNFTEVWRESADYQSLAFHELRAILADDRLNAPNEVEDSFCAIRKWISADVAERQKYLAQLLPCVRFIQCTIRECETVVTDPLVQADEDSVQVLNVIFETVCGQPMEADEFAGVDLSAQMWLTPRLPKGIVFLFGGYGDWRYGTASSDMHVYNCRTDSWRRLGEQDTAPRFGHGAAVLGSCIYIVGGKNVREVYCSVECFDVSRNEWSKKANLTIARTSLNLVALQGLIYAIGGVYDRWYTVTETVERYNPKRNVWCMVASMNEGRSHAASAVARGRIYIIGGTRTFRALDSVEYYDPSSNTWTRVGTLSMPRSSASAVAHDNMIYVMGGNGGGMDYTSMEVFDVRRGHFRDLPSMAQGGSGFSAVLLEGYIYVMGFFRSMNMTRAPVERYDIKAQKWYQLQDGPVSWYGTACVVYDVEQPERYL